MYKKSFHGTCYLTMLIVVASLDGLKKSEIEMKPNQAYETVTRAQPAAKIHTEPCSAYGVAAHATQVHVEPDYENVVQVHHH